MKTNSLFLLTCLSVALLAAPSTASADVVRVTSYPAAFSHPRWANGTNPTFRARFNLPLGDGRVADTEISFSPATFRHFVPRVVFLVPGSIGPLEFYDSNVPGFDAGDILAQEGYLAATSNLPGVGSSTGPANGRSVDAAFLGDFYLRVVRIFASFGRVDVYGEEGTGGNTVLLLAQHPDVVRTASSGANIYRVLTPIGQGALLSPQQQALLAAFPNGYFQPPPQLYAPFFASSTADFQLAACGGAGCPGPGGFLLTDGPYPEGIFYDAIAAFSPGGAGVVVSANGAAVPGFVQQGQFDFLSLAPDDSNALVADYGTTGGGRATATVLPNCFHFVRTDAACGNGPTSPFWANELAFLAAH